MIFAIYFENKELGRITFQQGQGIQIQSINDENLRLLLEQSTRHGVRASRDVPISFRERLKIQGLVRPTDEFFPFALASFLERHGYVMREFRDVDSELTELIKELPDDHALKKQFTGWLSTASYLEKTYLIAKLRGDQSVT